MLETRRVMKDPLEGGRLYIVLTTVAINVVGVAW